MVLSLLTERWWTIKIDAEWKTDVDGRVFFFCSVGSTDPYPPIAPRSSSLGWLLVGLSVAFIFICVVFFSTLCHRHAAGIFHNRYDKSMDMYWKSFSNCEPPQSGRIRRPATGCALVRGRRLRWPMINHSLGHLLPCRFWAANTPSAEMFGRREIVFNWSTH